MQIEKMLQAVDEATDLLKALAGRQRLLLLCHLSEGEKSVGQLARLIGARDSAVSQQLTLLRKDGLVATRRDGRSIHYSIASRPAARLIETLHELYCEPVGQAADTVVGHDVEMRREQA
jgi:DNA-binding transcriptional ArsR family regulator